MQDLVGGQIRIACDNFSSAWEQVKAGKIRALAITSAKRYSFAPDIPTVAEMFKDFEVQAWFGWIAPIGVPKAIVDKLSAELNAVGQSSPAFPAKPLQTSPARSPPDHASSSCTAGSFNPS
jgi:tripartite-type tricarboxylate transporter receptor subunit TctC